MDRKDVPVKENAVVFGPGQSLVGVFTQAHSGDLPAEFAVIMLNAGSIHRVGPNRIHVKLARRLAEFGVAALRFDFSGVGESRRSTDATSFLTRSKHEVRSAMDYLESSRGITHFVLLGICSGADVACALAEEDPRVRAAILVNGSFQSEPLAADFSQMAQQCIDARYYRRSVWELNRWKRLLLGRSNWRGLLRSLLTSLRRSNQNQKENEPADLPFVGKPLKELAERNIDLLAIYSEGSVSWDVIHLLYGSPEQMIAAVQRLRIEFIKNCDHVFTTLDSQSQLESLVVDWLKKTVKTESKSVAT